MKPIGGDQLRGHLESLVLAVLEDGPAHGWDICRRLDATSDGALSLKEGSVYPALYRLDAGGWSPPSGTMSRPSDAGPGGGSTACRPRDGGRWSRPGASGSGLPRSSPPSWECRHD